MDIRLSSYDEAVVGALEAAGAQMVIASPQQGSVTMAVLPQDLTAVGDVAGVEYVGEEFTPELREQEERLRAQVAEQQKKD